MNRAFFDLLQSRSKRLYGFDPYKPGEDDPNLPLPVISEFTATPSQITTAEDATSTLRWTVTHGTVLTINQGVGDVSTVFGKTVKPLVTTRYTLTARNSSGSVSRSVTVNVAGTNAPLAVSVNASNLTPTIGTSVSFTSQPTGGDGSYTYQWTFSDGQSSWTGASVGRTFATVGTHTATLTVTSGTETATASVQVIVQAASTGPAVTVLQSPANPETGDRVSLFANVTGGTAPYTFLWMWPDGTTGTGQETARTFSLAGEKTVTVKVNGGGETTATYKFRVGQQPPPDDGEFKLYEADPDFDPATDYDNLERNLAKAFLDVMSSTTVKLLPELEDENLFSSSKTTHIDF